ncbi:hypothetical protein [Streptomyces malaysiense]|uniref:Uncharacterized protein n=1 Tax=Streptomyces malaysiense TaxID=1428626 RepID=A0A1J4Q0G3_9ACTN|nr:hypothetical protein [Streptomyces malaysiense]OIK25862.1 hypothetical protein VT52_019255 [Streptomyces malaysiense]
MPQLPEDIIDRLTQMERRIQQLSTAVNTRPALNTVSGGGVEITGGGYLFVRPPSGGPATFAVGKWTGSEYGLAMRRQTGELALSLYNGDGTATSLQPLRIYDKAARELISDDIGAGGLARPWLAMLPPQDTATARWPQTTSASWTTIAMSYNVIWQPKMRLLLNTRTSSGATGSVRVLVNGAQWGSTVTAPTDFDYSGLVATDFASVYGTLLKVEVQAQVTSTSGTVYANPVLMYGRQT